MGKNKENNKDEEILIGKTLKDIRKSLGLTQEYVSEGLGLAPRYISDIERDKTKGSIDTLVKLCNLYRVTPTYVLQRYLSTSEAKMNNINKINGFEALSKRDRTFINNLVEFINQKNQNKALETKKAKLLKEAKKAEKAEKSDKDDKSDNYTTSENTQNPKSKKNSKPKKDK